MQTTLSNGWKLLRQLRCGLVARLARVHWVLMTSQRAGTQSRNVPYQIFCPLCSSLDASKVLNESADGLQDNWTVLLLSADLGCRKL